jgi:hypothetical protein
MKSPSPLNPYRCWKCSCFTCWIFRTRQDAKWLPAGYRSVYSTVISEISNVPLIVPFETCNEAHNVKNEPPSAYFFPSIAIRNLIVIIKRHSKGMQRQKRTLHDEPPPYICLTLLICCYCFSPLIK